MKPIAAIRELMEREDAISPKGGRKVTTSEFKDLTKDERMELGKLACKELGVEFEDPQ